MTELSNGEGGTGEHSPTPQSPEETVVKLLKDLAKEPTDENFATAQAFLDEKLAAAENDIVAFRCILKYFQEKNHDGFYPNDNYKYPIEYESPTDESPVRKLTRFILHREVALESQTRLASVLGDFPPRLHLEFPENWNYLMAKYVELPVFMTLPKANQATPDAPTSDWEMLVRAKAELAELNQRANNTISDFSASGYVAAMDTQVDIIKALHNKMGLTYKDGFLVQELE